MIRKIAVLYQAQLPPIKNGIQKPMKPSGYSDSYKLLNTINEKETINLCHVIGIHTC